MSRNLLYNHDKQDFFIEINHGPYIVDNNIFVDNNILLSAEAILAQPQGGAYIHNLIRGKISVGRDGSRFTSYFLPHSINMAGLTTIYGCDDRFYNNIIIGAGIPDVKQGLQGYDKNKILLPVWLRGNVFYNKAKPSLKDTLQHHAPEHNSQIKITGEGGNTFLQFTPDPFYFRHKVKLITTATLGKAKVTKAQFDASDGSAITFDIDYFGNKRDINNIFAGPFADLKPVKTEFKIW